MKIYTISDIHLEFIDVELSAFITSLQIPKDIDVLILAGDIGYPNEKLETFLMLLKQFYNEIIMIAGNHEYYECNFDRLNVLKMLRKICVENCVHFLEKESLTINDVVFHGTTLWSLADTVCESMNDFNRVFNDRIDYVEEFVKCYQWLKQTLLECKSEKQVVITHHLPDKRAISPVYNQYGTMNTGFYTDILNKVNHENVQLWVCGHTHTAVKKEIEGVTVYVNPVGYPWEPKTFLKDVVDV